jgi:hypothetical protein
MAAEEKNSTEFINLLIETFPEIKDELLDEDYLGLISLQIGCFRRYSQNAIDDNELNIVSKCFLFVESNFDNVEAPIKNSLYISYLGKLQFEKNIKAEELLPQKLRDAIDELKKAHEIPSKNKKLIQFLKGIKK